MDVSKHTEQIDVKWETGRAASVIAAVGVSDWTMSDFLMFLTICYTVLQIGLVLIKYWRLWRGVKDAE